MALNVKGFFQFFIVYFYFKVFQSYVYVCIYESQMVVDFIWGAFQFSIRQANIMKYVDGIDFVFLRDLKAQCEPIQVGWKVACFN